MSEPVDPGFTILPLMDSRFKDGVQYGTLAERQRISKLLEAWVADDDGDFDTTMTLIKGETNE